MSKSDIVDITRSVQKMYDEIGSHFSRTRQKTYGKSGSSNWIVTDAYLGNLKPGQNVLDVGCGNGKLVSGLGKGVEYTGTDFSKTLLSEAQKLHPNYDFRYGNAVESSHWAGLDKYNAIFCVAVLHHLPYKGQHLFVLKEAKKHLKKDGFIFISVWNLKQAKFDQNHANSFELKKTDPNWVEIPYIQDLPERRQEWKRFCYSFDIQTLEELVNESELRVEEIFYADRDGKNSDEKSGQNLVCIARNDAS